jgi:hypothetical protein
MYHSIGSKPTFNITTNKVTTAAILDLYLSNGRCIEAKTRHLRRTRRAYEHSLKVCRAPSKFRSRRLT